ncbi:MAG: nucleotide sugar dehydrogenase [Bauldia sp.]
MLHTKIASNDQPRVSAKVIPLGTNQYGAMLAQRIENRTANVGICGLGYVGLPLAAATARAGFHTTGFDVDPRKIQEIAAGRSYVPAVPSEELNELRSLGRLTASNSFAALASCDVICICVPTPLTPQREPDLSIVEAAARTIAEYLRPGQLVILESTTYPGTTDEVLKPIFEAGSLRSGYDFFLGYSPEREDPGSSFRTIDIPKVVSGDGATARELVAAFYGSVVKRVVPVSANNVAEMVKITENIFRFVNIGLINELKIIYQSMGVDIWEVIEAAKTKPFGFMPFYPGPGLGGHCIPVDPFYLTWKAREFGLSTRFVELAGEITQGLPSYVIQTLERALDQRLHQPMSLASILIVGVAYKKNVSDMRESPAIRIADMLADRALRVSFYDPEVDVAELRHHGFPASVTAVDLGAEPAKNAIHDAAIIVTDHDGIDYRLIEKSARVVIDTRNAMERNGISSPRVIKA